VSLDLGSLSLPIAVMAFLVALGFSRLGSGSRTRSGVAHGVARRRPPVLRGPRARR